LSKKQVRLHRLLLFRIPPHQFTLANNVTLHRAIQIRTLPARFQTQHLIKSINFEEISVRPGRRAWTAVARFAETILTFDRSWRAVLRNFSRLRIDIPNEPMGKQTARGVRIIDNENKTFRFRRHCLKAQRWTRVSAI